MTDESIRVCKNILCELSETMRYWNTYIDDFISRFILLDGEQRYRLQSSASPKIKFGLMCQVLGDARRNFANSDIERQKELARRGFILIAFDDFEFENRESILRYMGFLELREVSEPVLLSEWEKLSHLMSERILEFFSAYDWPPKS